MNPFHVENKTQQKKYFIVYDSPAKENVACFSELLSGRSLDSGHPEDSYTLFTGLAKFKAELEKHGEVYYTKAESDALEDE